MTKLGDCYQVAGSLVAFDPEYADSVLCHGEVWHDEVGWHGHAWVERTLKLDHPDFGAFEVVECVDRSNGHDASVPMALYYKIGRVRHVARYDREVVLTLATGSRHWGPWEAETS